MKKTLMFLTACILMLIAPGLTLSAPFLVCDPQAAGVDNYKVEISGPITIPIIPHSFTPMNTPRSTVTGWIFPRELVNFGRIRLSTVPTINEPQRMRPVPLKYSSFAIRIIEAGSQMIDVPRSGIKDMTAMTSPQKMTPAILHIKNPIEPREPWMSATSNCP